MPHAIPGAIRNLVACLLVAGLLAAGLPLAGCGGGGAKTEQTVRSTTVGQELMDLDKARQQGVISEKEYQVQRKKILDEK